MKKLIYMMLAILLLIGCQSQERYNDVIARADSLMDSHQDSARAALAMLDGIKSQYADMDKRNQMYYQLIYAKGMNKGFVDFTTDSVMKHVVAYYDKHGSANDRMLSYYLLGCAYRDMKDSPASLDCYNKAVACVDTVSKDCNYNLMAIINGQIGQIFLEQDMLNYALQSFEKTKKYAIMCKDSVLLLQAISSQANAYYKLGNKQKFIDIKGYLFRQYMKCGMRQDAALELCSTICEYVNQGNLRQAKQLMNLYEKKSGLVDTSGNVAEGKEIYYYTKGNFYLLCNQVDSAVPAYRKLLQKTEDIDEKEKAYRGLTKAYQVLGQKDSVAKYALLTQETNDSLFRKQSAITLIKMQSLYNYDQAERKAQHLATVNQYLKYMGGCFLLIVLLVFGIVVILMRQKNLKRRLEMKKQTEQLHLQLMQYLRDNQDLKKRITEIETPTSLKMYLQINDALRNSDIRRAVAKKVAKGQLVTEEELTAVKKVVGEFCPRFYVAVCEKEDLTDKQIAVCLLIRLFFSSVDLQILLGISSGYATNVKRALAKKLLGADMNPKEFEAHIHKMV